MTLTFDATYENGVLKPAEKLPLNDREKVQVTIRRAASVADQTYGMIGWSGDADAFDRLFQEADSDRAEPV